MHCICFVAAVLTYFQYAFDLAPCIYSTSEPSIDSEFPANAPTEGRKGAWQGGGGGGKPGLEKKRRNDIYHMLDSRQRNPGGGYRIIHDGQEKSRI